MNFALCIISCSSSDNATTTDPTAPVELRLTSGIEVETRATQSTQIAKDEVVKVWVDDATTTTAAYEANELTADGEGNFSGGKTMYFPQTGNKVNIYALHGNLTSPTKTGGSFTVTADQTAGGTAYTNSDLLLACQKDVARNGNPTKQALTFYHMLSKIELNIFTGDGAPSLATSGAVTIRDVITDGTLTADYDKDLTSRTNRAAMVTVGTTTSTMTLPQALSTTSSTVANEAIIVPQSMAGKVLTFTLANGGKLTYKFPDGTTFESGKKYVYKITLKLTELQVTSSVDDWDTGDEQDANATMADAPKAKDVSSVAIGDYYTSDGKLYSSEISDDDFAEIKSKIIGVVFALASDAGDNDKSSYPEGMTLHGYVIALNDANSGTWLTGNSTRILDLGDVVNDDTGNPTDWSGYKNTNAIISQYSGSAADNAKKYGETVKAPSNTSGWFLGGAAQLKEAFAGTNSTTVNTNITKAGGSVPSSWYWSSSEGGTATSNLLLYAIEVDSDGSISSVGKVASYKVRPILAF